MAKRKYYRPHKRNGKRVRGGYRKLPEKQGCAFWLIGMGLLVLAARLLS